MLGGILMPGFIHDRVLPIDDFQLLDFVYETEALGEIFGKGHAR
jgi:hypothetical protein